MWTRMSESEKGGSLGGTASIDFLSTHPANDKRIKVGRAAAAARLVCHARVADRLPHPSRRPSKSGCPRRLTSARRRHAVTPRASTKRSASTYPRAPASGSGREWRDRRLGWDMLEPCHWSGVCWKARTGRPGPLLLWVESPQPAGMFGTDEQTSIPVPLRTDRRATIMRDGESLKATRRHSTPVIAPSDCYMRLAINECLTAENDYLCVRCLFLMICPAVCWRPRARPGAASFSRRRHTISVHSV